MQKRAGSIVITDASAFSTLLFPLFDEGVELVQQLYCYANVDTEKNKVDQRDTAV